MKQPAYRSKRQLRLSFEHKAQYEPAEDLRAALVQVLADLLLEAMGNGTSDRESQPGVGHEPEDHA
ncbi:MAG: hypothetical protein JWQ90_4172 [Hydrocarboniphaga sp.]|uniref:hypothetical protein n=1 Tax=Hydrocarboniphaga sp. TaxID=2033016 RepID=UPI00260290AC|nr:hypothetical protein [Hydrocarboniphaga sp.]MDB5971722.1 hypothetical protein [Hydrocarboniphaga sp.]